ncbi:phage tail protein, partial [Elioraea sp. Yellowstone]
AHTADPAAAARWLAGLFGVPPDLVVSAAEERAARAVAPAEPDAQPRGLDPAA